MFRFSSVFYDNKGAVHQLVSNQLADMILFIFGPLGKNGIFVDENRAKAFAYVSCIDHYTKGKAFPSHLFPASSWENYLRIRYADMYRKLVDPNFAYTFNELGEAFLERILLVISKWQCYQYFCQFPDNEDRIKRNMRFDKYIPLIKRTADSKLETDIRFYAENAFEGWVDCRTDDFGVESDVDVEKIEEECEKQKKSYVAFANKVIKHMLADPLSYIYCEESEPYSQKIAEKYCEDGTFFFPFCESFVFWDSDYAFALESLSDLDEADSFFSTVGKQMRMLTDSSKSMFSLESDMCDRLSSNNKKQRK